MKKLNNLIVHCASGIVHQSKTLTLLLVMLMSVNMWGADVTYKWTFPFSSIPTNADFSDDAQSGATMGAYKVGGSLNAGSWSNTTKGSYFNLSSHFLIKVPISSSTTGFTLKADLFAWASKKYAEKTVTITYYTSKSSSEIAVCNGKTSTSGCYSVDEDITLSSTSVADKGTLYIKIAMAQGNDGFESLSVVTKEVAATKCEDPKISVAGGTYTTAQSVTLSCTTKDAAIHYTIDDSTPTSSSPTYSSAINVNQDMTIKAIATKNGLDNSEVVSAAYVINYKVTFNNNGHGTAPSAITPVKYNAFISDKKPADLSETGYTFGGWYKEQGCTNAWNWTNDKITSNTTLYAKWTANQTIITLSAPNADISQGTTQVTATYDKAMPTTSVTMPQRTGYTFNGYFDAESDGNKYYNANGTSAKTWNKDVAEFILHAQWTAKQYTITYKNQGNTDFIGTHETGYPKKHTYDQETSLKTATRNGYIFSKNP